jgi:AraC-like DNA-binding protein
MSNLVRELRSDSNRMPVWLLPDDMASWFCFGLSLAHDAPGTSFVEQHDLQLFLRTLRADLGEEWVPTTVQLSRTLPGAAVPIAEALPGANIRRGQFAAIAVERGAVRTPVRGRRPAGNTVPRAIAPQDLVSSLRAVLHALLAPTGPVHVRTVAGLLGTSQRSLQRRLAAAGTTYSDVLDELRRDLALELVGDTDLRMGDIASELGYADQAHFTRAFRRWTGESPLRRRRAG